MIVFNWPAVGQLILALIPGGIAYGIAWAVDGDANKWLQVITLFSWAIIDGLWRLANVAGDEDDPESGGVANLVLPSGGGHIFWLPGWLLGIGLGIARLLGYGA
ncbi:MAG: hypothetical protein VX899_01235 [Myxococcota bacterium]|nr:hypothetical protein [Myxococcota bacterium]